MNLSAGSATAGAVTAIQQVAMLPQAASETQRVIQILDVLAQTALRDAVDLGITPDEFLKELAG